MQAQSINCRGKLLELTQPIIMGILNITPDSFYDGGRYEQPREVLTKAAQMLEEGASILDVGGMSSRPGAALISEEEEIKRVLPVVQALVKEFPEAFISIDTVRSKVARVCLEAGAHIVNDISAGSLDPELIATVAEAKAPYILMHMQGRPANMQEKPDYQDVVDEVLDFFIHKVYDLRKAGITDIILDPGFGFGKTLDHNYQLLNQLADFQVLDLPILAGISRKSMIYKYLKSSPQEALNGTTALNMVALQNGAKILRVHDVKEAKEVIRLHLQLLTQQSC